jgi:hypothetical protein
LNHTCKFLISSNGLDIKFIPFLPRVYHEFHLQKD